MIKKIATILMSVALLLALYACSDGGEGGVSSADTDTSSAEVSDTVSGSADLSVDDGKISYTVYVVDGDGNAVPDVPVQLCFKSCYPGKTDANGKAAFSLDEGDYHATIMKMPEGYTYSTEETEFYFESGKTEMYITLKSVSEQSNGDGDVSSPSAVSEDDPSSVGGDDSSTPDITEGTKENPIGCFPDLTVSDNVTLTLNTTKIPANTALYFNLYRIGGRVVTIEDANVYVVYNDVKYTPVNGKIAFTAEDVMADRAITLQIGNTSATEKSFALKCVALYGTYDNPQIITSLDGGSFTVSLQEGNDQGYYCKYYAEKTGTLRLRLESATNNAKVFFNVTNQITSANRSNGEDGEFEGESYVEVAVTEGDEVLIILAAEPVKRVYPASDAVWSGSIN